MQLHYKGFEVTIDDEDYEQFRRYNWSISGKEPHKYLYCSRLGPFHRHILGNPEGMVVDHVDGNTFNNSRSNLRICTRKENVRAAKKRYDNTSGFRGVHSEKHSKNWRAVIKVNYKKIHLGMFPNRELAAEAYSQAAKKYFGEFVSRTGGT